LQDVGKDIASTASSSAISFFVVFMIYCFYYRY